MKILDRLPDDLFLVRFRGTNVVAESSLDLQRGMSAIGTVVSLDPKPLLRLYLPGERSALVDLLKTLNLPLTKLNGDSLSALLRRSIPVDRSTVIGLSSLIAGLRSAAGLSVSPDRLLLSLTTFQTDGAGLTMFLRTLPTGDSSHHLLTRLATHLHATAMDTESHPRDWDVFLYLPIWWNPEAGGEVKVFRRSRRRSSGDDEKNDESPEEVRIVVFLDPSPFGPMKIDITTGGKAVDLVMEVTRPEIHAFLSRRFPLLEIALFQLGYQDTSLRCTVVTDLVTHHRKAVDAFV
ncbi:MAG: hypothetical protein HY709_11885 [Candidatus Latescibacteria bacterium]|nr:hypothetical protein [Candidatus Latescibacterota bacterium]